MRRLLQFAQQRRLFLGIFRHLPLILLGVNDGNSLCVELFGVDPLEFLYSFIALSLKGIRNLTSGTFVLQSLEGI